RNGRDWHTLLEFCAFVNSLIIDEDGIYNARLVNDRLLLWFKRNLQRTRIADFPAAFTRGVAPEGCTRRALRHGRDRLGAAPMIPWNGPPRGGSVGRSL